MSFSSRCSLSEILMIFLMDSPLFSSQVPELHEFHHHFHESLKRQVGPITTITLLLLRILIILILIITIIIIRWTVGTRQGTRG